MRIFAALLLAAVVAGEQVSLAQGRPYRTLNDTLAAPQFTSLDEWNRRAAHIKELILESAGLLPMPERTALNANVFGEIRHPDYIVSKVYFESLPGFFVTGNLYRPLGDGPFPAILSPHGHWAYGRLENSVTASVPGRAISLARQGFVVFTHDMIGYNDSQQLEHRLFGGPREKLWGLSMAGLQLWNDIRALDFLESLPYVRRDAIGATGASGGGTQVFLLAAVDERVAVAAPVNMISLHMQGGCLCENQPGLRLDTNNVEIAATIAPRPLLMVSATGDWTTNTMKQEYPAVRALYALRGAADRVHGVQFDAPHNYNRDSREAVYAWMARWLQNAPADVRREEKTFTPDPLPDLLVFHERTLPANAVTAQQLTENWIEAARRQLSPTPLETRGRALRLALGFGAASASATANGAGAQSRTPSRSGRRTVIVAGVDAALERQLRSAGFTLKTVDFTPFDAAEAAKIDHFDTYNRTAASQRVADIVDALRSVPDAALLVSGDAALAGLFALAVEPGRRAVVDIDDFDVTSDAAFVERLYIPGLRRAGDFATATALAGDRIVIHNSGDRFTGTGTTVRREKLTHAEILKLLRER
jgi:dienelactone hydrolase